ncbi:MAG: flippase-like domain-containing protein [Actinobacteria bacterium]|nr:flippase-like domain-containing protein [Actinomycetota bacterium]
MSLTSPPVAPRIRVDAAFAPRTRQEVVMPSPLSRVRRPRSAAVIGGSVALVAVAVVVPAVDRAALAEGAGAVLRSPGRVVAVLAVYAAAFVLRAWAWRRILPRLSFGHALAGISVALGGNHVLPFRLGEALRVTSVVRRQGVPVADATASTLTLRSADIAAVVLLALAAGPAVVADVTGGWGWVLLPAALVGLGLGWRWLHRLGSGPDLRMPGMAVFAVTLVAWVLEAAVVHQAAAWVGVPLTPVEAVLVTAVTIAAQTFAVAPGGFGTYEAAATAVLVALGVDAGTGLAIALTAHGLKTLYALVAGGIAVFVPGPGLAGRLRVAAARPLRPTTAAPASPAEAPVVLFMPAYDEEACIADVVRRVPSSVAGRDVVFLVIDDGSRDATVARARAAGAEVVELGTNHGLGAAVRRGLAEGVARGAAAVVFCDADGEYAPEELERMVAPVLAGDADYVIGSRFAGDIVRMLPHRRFGNLVLTAIVRFVARLPVTDGQSGYRALSHDAAADAEVIHDFNYAQVLTLDLVAKGYRYAEVPISYRFRETGRSFVRLGRYLRAVVPAVWREVNDRGDLPEPSPQTALR